MNSLVDYKDLQKLGFSKKTSYDILKQVQESDEYKKTLLANVIKGVKVPTTLFIKKYPELRKEILEMKEGKGNE